MASTSARRSSLKSLRSFRSRPKRAAISCFARNRLFCSDMQNVRALSDAESVEEIQQILLAEE